MEKNLIIEKYFAEHSSSDVTKKRLISRFESQLKAEKYDNVPYYVAETFFRRVLSGNEAKKRGDKKFSDVTLKNCF